MTIPIARKERRTGPVRSGSGPAYASGARHPARQCTMTTDPVLGRTPGDHLDRLFRAAWALSGSREDAEDLVQDTYARVLGRPPVRRNDDDLGFLLRALRDGLLSGRRATARRRGAAGGEPGAPDLTDARIGATEPRDVFAAIAALPAKFRDVLVALDVAGLTYGEAAHALSVREGTLASRVFKARSKLATSLSQP
jgi:RNA polymerase sigma-70 factor, ECF subfamily